MFRALLFLPLMALGILFTIRADASKFDEPKEPDKPLFELRRGWDEPGEGRVKMKVKDREQAVYVTATADFTGESLVSIKIEQGPEEDSRVTFTFSEASSKKLAELTKEHLNKPLVILVKGEAIVSPTIREPFSESVQLRGSYADIVIETLEDLARRVESLEKPED